jgi:DNA-binding MarR family transcriptional regulator
MNIHAIRKRTNPTSSLARHPMSRSCKPGGAPAPADRFIDGYLSYLLARASHTVYSDFHAQVQAAGLSQLEWRLLATLSDGDGLTIGELAREILAQQPTLTKLVQRMEKAGWVRRGEDPADARRTLVFETGQGRATVAALLAQAKAHEASLLQDFSERDVAALKKILRALIDRGDGQ